jgi:hypothetical protein
VTSLTSAEQAKAFSTSDRVVVIGIFSAPDSPRTEATASFPYPFVEHVAFKQIANELRNSFTFGEVIGNAAIGDE